MTVGVLAIIFVVLLAVTADQRNAAYSAATTQSKQETYKIATADEILSLVNQKRGEAGVEPLIVSNELQISAQWKADDMANRGYFEHTDPTTTKKNGIDKAFELTGLFCSYISENIHYGEGEYITSYNTVKAWMESKSHKDALLDSKYSYTGIGVAADNSGKVYQVQQFCQKA